MAESNVFLYRRLERQKVLRGFNCIDGEYPENSMDITPAKLEEVSGISVTSLTPKQRTTYWQLAGIGLCLSEYIFGTSIGIDPLFTLIPATFFLFGSDQVFFKGAFFETLYRSLFPEYKQKVICHEAGHFLIAYLLGIPIRACITNAWDARKYPEIRGPAGTIFYDNRMAEELQKGQVARSSLDRLSIALMAGIAAEAVTFNVCEGGVADEQSLVSLFAPLQPAWNIIRIQGQARWAVLQAILLIREHKGAFDAVVKGLEENKSVGDIIFDLEQQLPKELPSQKRIRERNLRNKQRESNFLLRFIQNKTWMVGGIQEGEGKEEESPSEEKTVSHQEAVSVAPGEDIAIKMDHLEQAVTNGDIDISQAKEGGIWLNGLQTYNSPTSSSSSTVSSGSNDDFIRTPAKVALPSPKEGYEQVVEKFLKKEDQEKEDENSQNWTPRTMLTSHRGYQMKELELEQARKANKVSPQLNHYLFIT